MILHILLYYHLHVFVWIYLGFLCVCQMCFYVLILKTSIFLYNNGIFPESILFVTLLNVLQLPKGLSFQKKKKKECAT